MKIKTCKIGIILVCLLFIAPAANIFSQEQIQQQPQQKEESIDLGRFSDNTHHENANQFYKLKKFDIALELFTEYLEIYLNGLHRKYAYKKIALIYFEQFNYIKSIKSFKSLYEEYSNSEEGIEAFFMTGICYQKMGFYNNAKQVFKTLMEEHPESNFAYQAKIKLDLIEILEKR
ncbi:MAG: tetratricopeptide repeat protein [Spirochaetes bacterium]|nr:tetratricopeptide repeat protein [Spirochaetota bacterium]